MPSYSRKSANHLSTATEFLQRVFNRVVAWYDNTIIEGYRPEDRQDRLFDRNLTKVKYPNSKHNRSPAEAVDSAPYFPDRKIPWPKRPDCLGLLNRFEAKDVNKYIKDLAQFYHYAGFVQAVAKYEGGDIRWGGNWDMDHTFHDNTFDDLVHFEDMSNGSKDRPTVQA